MITVTHDQEPASEPAEPCAFCKAPTRYWFKPKDVAVCPSCAELRTADEVPCKRDWINSNRLPGSTLLPADWQCHADRRAAAQN